MFLGFSCVFGVNKLSTNKWCKVYKRNNNKHTQREKKLVHRICCCCSPSSSNNAWFMYTGPKFWMWWNASCHYPNDISYHYTYISNTNSIENFILGPHHLYDILMMMMMMLELPVFFIISSKSQNRMEWRKNIKNTYTHSPSQRRRRRNHLAIYCRYIAINQFIQVKKWEKNSGIHLDLTYPHCMYSDLYTVYVITDSRTRIHGTQTHHLDM